MTDRYAVIGNPVAHSKSPAIHSAFAQSTRQAMEYTRIEAPRDGFADAVANFAAAGGRGLNVTLPFKLEAFALADATTTRAAAAGACNTLKREAGRWHGDNTDGAGLMRDLTVNLGVALAGRDVLVLGAGGAARGVLLPLAEARPRMLVIANRTTAKAFALARNLAPLVQCDAAGVDELAGRDFDVVINATSAGLANAAPLPWPATLFRRDALAYDMVYGDEPTLFLRWARAAGAARCADGLGMLVEQAAESFAWWRGVRPDTAATFERMRPRRG
ncbi:MAG: shikimate dehydrogenase [Betaproteobacteria bacterium]